VQTRLLHTEGFRIAAIFVAIFAVSVAALAIVTLTVVDQELRNQIVQFANADIGSVRDGYRTQGEREASEVVGQRMASPGASDFFLLQRGGSEKLAGNLAPMVPRTGIITLPGPKGVEASSVLGVGAFIAPGLYAFAGSDLRATEMARRRIVRTLIWIFAVALALALLGGMIVSRSFLRRTDEIVTTCRAIMAGNLASRIPVRGTEDELDRLSETINAMLDRIAALMDNLKQITNDIAHDLRTPVTHLRHRLERARDQSSKIEDYDQALEAAIATSDDILALFSALLRIAQIEGGARRANFVPLELSSLLVRLGDVFGPVAEDARHHLSLSPGDPVTILGDRELLTQAFSNLIENAILHTPAGTIVTVSLAHRNGEAVVTISDDGPGVPPNEHPKLFQRFYRLEASRTRPGYGLGLALVAAIAELHGASIVVDSEVGRGFSISLHFPNNLEGS